MGNPISEFIAQFKATQNDTGVALNQVNATRDSYSAQSDELVKAIREGGDASRIIELERARADAVNEAKAQKIATDFGTNLADTTQIISALALKESEAASTKESALQTIQKKQSTGILDNPLEWVMNRLTVNSDIDKYNLASTEQKNASERIATLNMLTQETVKTQNAINQGNTAATVLARANKVASSAKIQASLAALQAKQFDVDAISKVTALGNELLSNQFKLKDVQYREQAHQDALSEADMRRAAIEDNKIDRRSKEEQMKQVAADVNAGMAYINPGSPPLTPEQAFSYLSLVGTAGDTVRAYQTAGITERLGTRSLGTAGESGRTLLLTNAPDTGISGSLNTLLKKSYSDVVTGVAKDASGAKIQIDTSNPAKLLEATTAIAKTEAVKMETLIKEGDANNIYKAPPIASLLPVRLTGAYSSLTVGDLPFISTVITPALKTGMTTDLPPSAVAALGVKYISMATTREEVVKKVEEVANETWTLYRAAVNVNNAHIGYSSKGIQNQNSYKAELPFYGSTRTIDILNKTAYKEYLIQRLVTQGAVLAEPTVGVPK